MLRLNLTPREDVGVKSNDRHLLPEYCKNLGNHPLLPKETEFVLCRRIAQGDQEARDKLVLHNMRLVISIAYRYVSWSSHLTWDDLIQAGSIGVMRATEEFDLNRKCRFTTYAVWWIRHFILRELHNNGDIIRIPVHVIERRNRTLKTARRFVKGAPPTIQEIANHLRVSVESVREDFESLNLKDPVSLDSLFASEDPVGPTMQDFIPDAVVMNPIILIEAQQELEEKYCALEDMLKAVKGTLGERNLLIFKEIYGLNNEGKKKSRVQVAKDFDIARERVRQILVRIYKELSGKGVANEEALNDHLLSIQELEKIVGGSRELTI